MTTATISKEFTFSASHRLYGLDPEHPCSRLHGHNYTVRLTLTGHTDEVGFVIDYRALGFFKDLLDNVFDHRDLNDVLGPDFNPTAENLAHHLLDTTMTALDADHPEALSRITNVDVAVSETPKTWAHVSTQDVRAAECLAESQQVDPHLTDQDRYRWNFDRDGAGK